MDKEGLADFLRRRRESLKPRDVGLEPDGRRQVSGLRRDEVARLAHISTDFYTRIEQARGARPSEETIGALARALRLNPIERDHLYQLGGYTSPQHALRAHAPSPGLLRVMASVDSPAQIVSDLGATLAQNPLARALVGEQVGLVGPERYVAYRWFVGDRSWRDIHPEDEHARISSDHVAALRAAHARLRRDPEADALIESLLARSLEFAGLWERHEVVDRSGSLKRFRNSAVGELTLDCQVLAGRDVTERLLVFAALPGSEDAAKLEALAASVGSDVLGQQAVDELEPGLPSGRA